MEENFGLCAVGEEVDGAMLALAGDEVGLGGVEVAGVGLWGVSVVRTEQSVSQLV